MGKNNGALSEVHCHTKFSTDGECGFEELLDRAERMKLEYFSTTDHNNMEYIRKYLESKGLNPLLAYHKMKNTKYIPGVEVTCRINHSDGLNRKGNPSKIHMLVYSPILQEDNLFNRLMQIKHTNDISYDYGVLIEIAKLKSVALDENQVREYVRNKRQIVPGFSSIDKRDIYNFFEQYYPGLFSSPEEAANLCQEIRESARLNLDALYTIQAAHEAGGLCVLAHPEKNFERMRHPEHALATLFDYGLDGVETRCLGMKKKGMEIVNRVCSRHKFLNKVVFTGGSDFHEKNEFRDLAQYKDWDDDTITYIKSKHMPVFIDEVERLNKVRKQGELTHRIYRAVSPKKLEKQYSQMEAFVNENKFWQGKYPIFDNSDFDLDMD